MEDNKDKDFEKEELNEVEESGLRVQSGDGFRVIPLKGLIDNWFIDYASSVILDRAVPEINDGLKPVQRRILHSMKELEDGRYNKVANVVGNTMKYHPHGDSSIGDALVNLGQKDLLIDTQGNWGNVLTGDPAAAEYALCLTEFKDYIEEEKYNVPGNYLIGHTGGAYGLNSIMIWSPADNWGIVAMTNGFTSVKDKSFLKSITRAVYNSCIKE